MKIADSAVRHAGQALAAAAVDVLARQRGEHVVAVRVLARGAAERAGERARPPSRAIATAALAAQPPLTTKKSWRLRFAVRLRKAFDLEHLVEHDDAGAKDRRCAAGGHRQRKSTSSSTQARMM